ncbi:MAG TPA: HEAT repeat domain-containing protein [Longimicrobium sp.]|nr:HEAT repeat domain-containing protein [Longimicrobium sp.]
MPATIAHLLEAAPRVLPELFLKATLVLATAGLLSRALRRASASARHLVWAVAITGVVALAFSPLLPRRVPILPPLGAAPAVDAWTATPAPSASDGRTPAAQPSVSGPARTQTPVAASERQPTPAPDAATPPASSWTKTPAPAAHAPVDWTRALLGIWVLGAGVLLLRLLIGMGTVMWLARVGEREADEGWVVLADRLTRAYSLPAIRLIRSRWTEMPMTWGVLRPIVLLPMNADEWPLERREAVLTHELAHVARKDVLTLALAQVAVALHWFNPLAWIALREVRAEAEKCCDDWVLRGGMRASTYASHLLEMVRVVGRARVPAALALPMAQRSTFEGRLLAILEPGVERGRVRRGQAALTALGIAGLVAVLGAMGPAQPRAALASADGGGEWNGAAPALLGSAPDAGNAWLGEKEKEAKPVASGAGLDAHASAGTVDAATRAQLARLAPDVAAAVNAALPAAPANDAAPGNAPQTAQADQEGRAQLVARLAGALKDANAEVRVTVAHSLGQIRDPRSVAALINALRTDQDATVRKTAAWALGQIEDAAAVPALVEAMQGDRSVEVRRTATWALGQIESPTAVDGLVRAMHDSDAEVRRTAVWALGQIEDARAVPGLTDALKDGDADTRKQAAWALGQIESPTAVPALTALLHDGDADVRQTAVWALGQIESPAAVPALTAVLRDANAGARKQAAWALGQIESESAIPALGGLVQNDPDTDVRQTAAWALGQIEKPSALGALSAALRDRSPAVRAQAAWAIGQIEPDHAPEALVAAARDADRSVRSNAIWALGQIEDASAVPALRAALRDSDPQIKQLALRALSRTGDPSAADALAEMLKDPDPQVRAAAAAAIAGHGSWVDPRPEPRPQPRPEPRPRPEL